MFPDLILGGIAANFLIGCSNQGEEPSRSGEVHPSVATPPREANGRPIPPALGHHAAIIAGYRVTSDDEYIDVNDKVYDRNLRGLYGEERQKAQRSIFSELGIFLPEIEKSPHIPELFNFENSTSGAKVRAERGERERALESFREAERAARDGNFFTPVIQERLTVLRFSIEHLLGKAGEQGAQRTTTPAYPTTPE